MQLMSQFSYPNSLPSNYFSFLRIDFEFLFHMYFLFHQL
jgi:hypothetical protein